MALAEGTSHAAEMDAIYRLQRHIYDATRKYYLLGRDRLIEELRVPEGGTVLEVGCGTGRNLILAARRYPNANFAGCDISKAMLETAAKNIEKAGLAHRIRLAAADAATFEAHAIFGHRSFDRVFCSYTLSMIPPWEAALERAYEATAPGGSLHVVDFGDQAGLPPLMKRALRAWLARFQVTPRSRLEEVLTRLAHEQGERLAFARPYRDYTQIAKLSRPAQPLTK